MHPTTTDEQAGTVLLSLVPKEKTQHAEVRVGNFGKTRPRTQHHAKVLFALPWAFRERDIRPNIIYACAQYELTLTCQQENDGSPSTIH